MSSQNSSGIGSNPIVQQLSGYRESFAQWRRKRPFPGAMLLLIGGLFTVWVPFQVAADMMLVGQMITGIGLLWGALMLTAGLFAMKYPEESNKIGIFGVVVSILSIFGALGGLLVGMVFGIIGGNLCYGWHMDDDIAEEVQAEESQFSWEDDDSSASETEDEDIKSRIARLINRIR